MARPRTEDGFVMIALDLFAALMAADLPNRCQIVLAEVLAAQYGPTKAKSVHLDPAQIEHYTGLHRNNARKAIGELTRAGILAVQADGSHAFVKDYESWTPGGKPMAERLGGGILRFANATLSRHGLPTTRRRNASASGPIQPDCQDAPPTIPIDCNDQASVAIQGDCHEAPETIPMDCGRATLTDVVNPEGLTHGPSPQSPGIAATVDTTGVGGNRKRACASASEDLETLDQIHTHSARAGATQVRSAGDMADIDRAKAILSADINLEFLALELGRKHNAPGCMGIAGWQWVYAAHVHTDGSNELDDGKRRSWSYFAKVAGNATREKLARYEQPAPAARAGTTAPARPRFETAQERRKREWNEKLEEQRAKRAAHTQENFR